MAPGGYMHIPSAKLLPKGCALCDLLEKEIPHHDDLLKLSVAHLNSSTGTSPAYLAYYTGEEFKRSNIFFTVLPGGSLGHKRY
jgi:hypothetical protein